MKKLLAALIAPWLATAVLAADSAGYEDEGFIFAGDAAFDLGGLKTEDIAGDFVKDVDDDGTLTQQACDANLQNCADETVELATDAELAAIVTHENIVVDVPPSAATLGKLIYRTGDQSYYRTRSVGGITPAKATFANYADRAFIGNFAAPSDLPNANASPNQGTWAWVYGELQAYRSIRNVSSGNFEWVDVDVDRIVAGVNYIGHYADDALATPHVTQVGDLYNDDTLNVLKAAATFTAQSGTPTRYEQDRLITRADGSLTASDLPPYENTKIIPEGLPDSTWPSELILQVGHKNDPDRLTKLEVLHGNTVIYTQNSAAALAILNTSVRGLVKIELPISGTKATLDTASARQGVSSIGLGLVFTFGDREVRENITIPVNNDLFAGGGGDGDVTTAQLNTERTARQSADTALGVRIDGEISARQTADTALKGQIDDINARHHAALLTVWPPNVPQHTSVQRNFKAILNELDQSRLLENTRTDRINTFQIKARNADDAVVVLHSQGWTYATQSDQELEWAVSAAEFNQLSLDSSTDFLQVWGEFRYINTFTSADQLRQTTDQFVIGFGEEDEWPATRGEVPKRNTTVAPRIVADAGDFGNLGTFADGGHAHQLLLLPGGGLNFDTQKRLHVTGTAVAQLNIRDQIGLLNTLYDPGSITYTNVDDLADKVKRIRVNFSNPEVLSSSVWASGAIQGQPGTGTRVEVSKTTAGVTITLADASADAVASALVTDSDPHVDVRLTFFDAATAGNEIEIIGANIPIINVPTPSDPPNLAVINEAPATSSPVVPTSSNSDKLLLRGAPGARETYYQDIVHRTVVTVTMSTMTTALLRTVTGNSALSWGGSVQINPSAGSDLVAWSIPAGHFIIRQSGTWNSFNMPRFLGRFPNENDAKASVSANNQVAEFGNTVYVSESYTRRDVDDRNWVPTRNRPVLQVENTRSGNGFTFWTGTQAQYDAITTKNATTVYLVTD